MTSNHKIKIYNKDSKIKALINDAGDNRVVSLYKHEGEVKHIHSYTIKKKPKSRIRMVKDEDGVYVNTELKIKDRSRDKYYTYYDYIKTVDNIPMERIRISNIRMEHLETVGELEVVKTQKVFESGNVYKTREKIFNQDGVLDVFKTIFKNGDMEGFLFSIPENKIDEYLKKINYER